MGVSLIVTNGRGTCSDLLVTHDQAEAHGRYALLELSSARYACAASCEFVRAVRRPTLGLRPDRWPAGRYALYQLS